LVVPLMASVPPARVMAAELLMASSSVTRSEPPLATVTEVATEQEEAVAVAASKAEKCERCWHYRADVGAHADHPTLCGRCYSNLFGAGEKRKFA